MGFSAYLRANALFVLFAVLAVGVRIAFWAYTDRTWEDAMISLTPAANVWDGIGLTHHASEPRVHSFTSALGELVLIAGEAFDQGILAMRLASLAAATTTIFFAHEIGRRLNFTWPAQVLVLGYLALDHLQVFFGMAGVETQIAVALALGVSYFFLERRWVLLGVATGLALICRPEFLLWGALLGVAMIVWHRAATLKVALPALAVAGPWVAFATLYYGSPVPFTIVVKSSWTQISLSDSWQYLLDSWPAMAPFKEFWFVDLAPVPDSLLIAIVGIVLALAIVGMVAAAIREPRIAVVALFLLGFVAYRAVVRVNPYFMWYLPPFLAILILFAGAGLNALLGRVRPLAGAMAIVLVLAYAVHLPLTFELDRQVQSEIEVAVRTKVGERLNELMGPDDTVVLEPLGFIGWAARNKTIYDIPGLGSPTAFRAFAKHKSMAGMVDELSPTFLAARPWEWNELVRMKPEVAARYDPVETFAASADFMTNPDGLNRQSYGGLAYRTGDAVFTIYRRQD